jgi:LuxR family transcriptional regulator, maltose regulon positive regulatory protein
VVYTSPAGSRVSAGPDAVGRQRALSLCELEVVQLLARQMSTTQIAADMSISVNTVRTRVRGALRKLDAVDREGAVRTARARGLV